MGFIWLVMIFLLTGNVAVVKANNCWQISFSLLYTVGPSVVTVTQSDANAAMTEVLNHGKSQLSCSGLTLKLMNVTITTPGGVYSINGLFGVIYGNMDSSQKAAALSCLANAVIFNDIVLRPDYYTSPLKGTYYADRATLSNYQDATCCFNGMVASNGVCVSPAPSLPPSTSIVSTSVLATPYIRTTAAVAKTTTTTLIIPTSTVVVSVTSTIPTTTPAPTTQEPTTQAPTTQEPTTQKPTTQKPTTQKPTTQKPTTQKPTTQKPKSTTEAPKPTTAPTPQPTTPAFFNFVNFVSNKRVILGNTVKLTCAVVGTASNIKMDWYKNDKLLDNVELSENGWNYTKRLVLTIKDVTASQAGEYICGVDSSIGIESKILTLEVQVSKHVEMAMSLKQIEFHQDLSNSSSPRYQALAEEFKQQGKVVFSTIKGFQRIEVTGFKSGSVVVDFRIFISQVLSAPQNYPPDLVKEVNTIMIEQVKTGSFGNYSVSNDSLFLKAIPPPPINIKTEKETKSIKLWWEPPVNWESYHITKYILEYKKSGESKFKIIEMDSNRFFKIIENLESNTQYDFRLSSKNAVGQGTPSPRISVTTLSFNPVIDNDKQEFTFKKGEKAVIFCIGSSEKRPEQIEWISDYPSSAKQYKNETEKTRNIYLTFTNVQETNAGIYKCRTSIKGADGEGSVTLTVIVPVEVNLNATLVRETFTNDLNNNTTPKYKRLKIKFEHELSKLYVNFTGFLRVEVIGFSNGSVKVRFRVVVEVKIEEAKQQSKPTRAKVDVTTRIIKKVQSSDGDIGGGLFIKPNSVTTDAPPPSPLKLNVTEIRETMVHLRWLEPENAHAFSIHSYIIKAKKFGEEWKEKRTTQRVQLDSRVEELEDDARYTVTVFARGDGGDGLDSNEQEFKTKENEVNLTWLWVCLALFLVLGIMIFLVYHYKKKQTVDHQYDPNGNRRASIPTNEDPKNVHIYSYRNDAFALTSMNFESLGLMPGKWWEIPRRLITLGDTLGAGQFGIVKKGEIELQNGPMACAVKMLKESAGDEEARDLINELEIMVGVGTHVNLVNLIGACTYDGPLMIALEFAEGGSLLSHIKTNVMPVGDGHEASSLSDQEKLRIGLDIAKGMQHLAHVKCVHRDLAARNVLLTADNRAKIADFGLSRDVYERGFYEKQSKGKLPVRWMSPEAIQQMMFTTKGDIWSYGVVLWEIESGGKLPYGGLSMLELIEYLKKGQRLARPRRCVEGVYNLMLHCWHMDPNQRPNFDNICTNMEELLSQTTTFPQVEFAPPRYELHPHFGTQ